VLGLSVAALLMRLSPQPQELRSRLRVLSLLVGLQVLLLPAAGVLSALSMDGARDVRLFGSVLATLAFVGLGGFVVFGIAAPRMQLRLPRIVQDLLVGAVGTLAVFGTASRAGVNLSGIVTTGAVLTAVVGLALQDMLGNVLGGLSLQLDSTIRVGDWIRIAEVTGRVTEIRWRSTSIETRNWETVILPNSVLTRAQVTVLGRRSGQPQLLRRWINFNVDFRVVPTQVIEVVIAALRSNPIDGVAASPAPDCILMDLGESTARYAVRYHLSDLSADDPTDSVVRTRVYFALSRAGIPLAMPAHAVFLTEDSAERKHHKRSADLERRVAVIARIALFHEIDENERLEIANSLHRAPFARGEILTREGADAHHLYVIYEGQVSVRVREAGTDREVAKLGEGEFFGEMSLLTGEKRAATVVALTDVECYRLDAEAFKHLLERRPETAEKVAAELAERRVALLATRERIGDRKSLVDENQRDLLKKIRSFFQI
jgi:small-conductance mechanosensitive channel